MLSLYTKYSIIQLILYESSVQNKNSPSLKPNEAKDIEFRRSSNQEQNCTPLK